LSTDLHSTARELVHDPDAMVPSIVVAVVAIGSGLTYVQLTQHDAVPQV